MVFTCVFEGIKFKIGKYFDDNGYIGIQLINCYRMCSFVV